MNQDQAKKKTWKPMERRSFFKLAGATATTLALGATAVACDEKTRESLLGVDDSYNEGVSVGVPVDFSETTDVLIVGSGIAGLSAAMDPSEAGLSVIVADKLDILGGESFTAAGILHVSGSDLQKDAGITTSVDDGWKKLKEDIDALGNTIHVDLSKKLFDTAPQWVNRIVNTYNASFCDPKSYIDKGSPDSFLMPKHGLGDMASIMSPLKEKLSAQGVSFKPGLRASHCILDASSKVVGMRFYSSDNSTITDIQAKKIIMACGDFSANQEMIHKFLPAHEKLACYTSYTTGDGHLLCQTLHGQVSEMDNIPPLSSDIPFVESWGFFAPILSLSPQGIRIAAEDKPGAAAQVCVNQELGYWWTIFDNQISTSEQSKSASYVSSKNPTRVVGPCNSLEDLAVKMGVSQDKLKNTFDSYNKMVSDKKDTEYGKTFFLNKLNAPYFAIKQFPNRFRTYGGILTDTNAHVLDTQGAAIEELFCCGANAAGSYFGISSHAAFGMIAGQNATLELQQNSQEGTEANRQNNNQSTNQVDDQTQT